MGEDMVACQHTFGRGTTRQQEQQLLRNHRSADHAPLGCGCATLATRRSRRWHRGLSPAVGHSAALRLVTARLLASEHLTHLR